MPKLLGDTIPRLFTPPLVQGKPGGCECGCSLTRRWSFGYSLIDFIETLVDVKLLPWQRWLAIHAFESAAYIPPGMPIEMAVKQIGFRFRTLLILIARQNGKTTLIELKNLWKMYVLQVPLVIGTAQKLDLAEESWMKAVEIAEGVPELAAEIQQVNKTNGKKSLQLTNGSRWKIEPATRGGGRGLSGDDVNLDELREHQTWVSWGAVTKTTMARPNAQIFAFTNAGDDKSIVLNTVQEQARSAAEAILELLNSLGRGVTTEQVHAAAEDRAIDTSVFLAEWSVPDDVKCTCLRNGSHPHKANCQLQDRKLWAMANPSLGYTITEHAIASSLATDPEAIFRTEVLCQRVPDLAQAQIDIEQWRRLGDTESRRAEGAEITISADISPSRDHASIVMYSTRADGNGHTELIEYYSGAQVKLVARRIAQLKERHDPLAITLDPTGPAASLVTELDELGIKRAQIYQVDVAGPDGYYVEVDRWDRGGLFIPTTREIAAGAAQFSDAIRDGGMRHRAQPPYDQAAAGVKALPLGDGFRWGRRLAVVDITPICGGSTARFAHVKLLPILKPSDDYNILDSVY